MCIYKLVYVYMCVCECVCVARHQHYNIDPKKRLSFASGYLNFDFTNVIFSDECCVYIGPERKRVTHINIHI